MRDNGKERLPQVVEDRMQEAYEMIRRGEVRQMERRKDMSARSGRGENPGKGKRRGSRRWFGMAAAVLALVIAVPSAVYAAVVYFQRSTRQEGDTLRYEFALNYELVPGEYQVKAGYLPENFKDEGDGKYRSTEDEGWITLLPVYTTAELDRIEEGITVEKVENIEHTELSGMPADVITPKEAEKYERNTYVFLFNEAEGYVLNIAAGNTVDRRELLKFADSLTVERTGDVRYETEEEKSKRQKEESDAASAAREGQKRWDRLMELGIPEEKLFDVGEALYDYDGSCSYTVTGYEFLDGIEGFSEDGFFDLSRFDGWLKEDKTLRPYTRMHFDKNGELLEEAECGQEILRVDLKVHCYEDMDVPVDFTIQYTERGKEQVLTWAEDYYEGVPQEDYWLQMDNSAVYFDQAVNTAGDSRSHFFWREMKTGEEFACTLLFVVDEDRKEDILLYPTGSCNDLWQTESMTAEQIREGLEGYIRLK